MSDDIYDTLRKFHDSAVDAVEQLRWWLKAYWATTEGDRSKLDAFRLEFITAAEGFLRYPHREAFDLFAQAYEILAERHNLQLQPEGCESYHRVAQSRCQLFYPVARGVGSLTRSTTPGLHVEDLVGWLRREWSTLIACIQNGAQEGDSNPDRARRFTLHGKKFSHCLTHPDDEKRRIALAVNNRDPLVSQVQAATDCLDSIRRATPEPAEVSSILQAMRKYEREHNKQLK